MSDKLLYHDILQGFHDDKILEAILEDLYKQPLIALDEKLLSPNASTGIYCIYYVGVSNTLYNGITSEFPIYIGKASKHSDNNNKQNEYTIDEEEEQPEGKLVKKKKQTSLYKRISEHRKSISDVEKTITSDVRRSICLHDFRLRYLPLGHTMTAGCETILISYYRPLWNVVVPGFGKHTPGKTRTIESAPWDLVHVGRWCKEITEMMQPKVDEILLRVEAWCRKHYYTPRHQTTSTIEDMDCIDPEPPTQKRKYTYESFTMVDPTFSEYS